MRRPASRSRGWRQRALLRRAAALRGRGMSCRVGGMSGCAVIAKEPIKPVQTKTIVVIGAYIMRVGATRIGPRPAVEGGAEGGWP